jgi:hypothetical protein
MLEGQVVVVKKKLVRNTVSRRRCLKWRAGLFSLIIVTLLTLFSIFVSSDFQVRHPSCVFQ